MATGTRPAYDDGERKRSQVLEAFLTETGALRSVPGTVELEVGAVNPSRRWAVPPW